MNLTTMITRVRRDLRDEDADNYLWTDDELERHISHAVFDLSGAIPRQRTAAIPTTDGSMAIDISGLSGLVYVQAVEYPGGEDPRSYRRFSTWDDTVTLLGSPVPDGSDCTVYYGSVHTLDAGTSTIPTRYEDLVAAGAAGYALISWGACAINRVNLGGTDAPQDYSQAGNSRLAHFHRELRRLGRRNRVLVSRLFAPSISTGGY